MGCSSAKIATVQDSVRQVSDNPAKGLPNLLTVMKQPEENGEPVKNLAMVFKALPQALASLKVENPKPIVAACDVIVECVSLHNKNGALAELEASIPTECLKGLATLLHKVQDQASQCQTVSFTDCEKSTKEAKAIANATHALFKLEGHAADCKKVVTDGAFLKAAIPLLAVAGGVEVEAKQALVSMLVELVKDSPEVASAIVRHGGVGALRAMLEKPREHKCSKETQLECCKVLEVCLQCPGGLFSTSKDEVKALIAKCRGVQA